MRSVPLARRSALADPRRLVTTVAGVGTALALILLLSALWAGLRGQSGAYADNAGADLVVTEAGTRTIEVDSSVLPLEMADAVDSVPGVRAAHPVLYRYWTCTGARCSAGSSGAGVIRAGSMCPIGEGQSALRMLGRLV